jgi:hypothetical protein
LSLLPEARLAARLVQLRGLTPPVDVRALVAEFSDLREMAFPADVDMDGVCLGLKRPGRRPIVIVNSRKHALRRRFTLAHELGHLIIPWHTGNVFDNTSRDDIEEETDYWRMEAEANRFASELLMPTCWVKSLLTGQIDPPSLVRMIQSNAQVSHQSAAYKLASCLPVGFVYAEVLPNGRLRPGASSHTPAVLPYPRQVDVLEGALPWATRRWKPTGSTGFWWWDTNFHREPIPTEADWKVLLKAVLDELLPLEDQLAFKASLNGVLAAAHGQEKQRTPANVLNACLQRLHIHAEHDERYAKLITHSAFAELLDARVLAFFRTKRRGRKPKKDT